MTLTTSAMPRRSRGRTCIRAYLIQGRSLVESINSPSGGLLRASKAILQYGALLTSLPELIDRETGVREIFEILQSIMAQAGDLIESRSPELVAAARTALTRYNDEALGEALGEAG